MLLAVGRFGAGQAVAAVAGPARLRAHSRVRSPSTRTAASRLAADAPFMTCPAPGSGERRTTGGAGSARTGRTAAWADDDCCPMDYIDVDSIATERRAFLGRRASSTRPEQPAVRRQVCCGRGVSQPGRDPAPPVRQLHRPAQPGHAATETPASSSFEPVAGGAGAAGLRAGQRHDLDTYAEVWGSGEASRAADGRARSRRSRSVTSLVQAPSGEQRLTRSAKYCAGRDRRQPPRPLVAAVVACAGVPAPPARRFTPTVFDGFAQGPGQERRDDDDAGEQLPLRPDRAASSVDTPFGLVSVLG